MYLCTVVQCASTELRYRGKRDSVMTSKATETGRIVRDSIGSRQHYKNNNTEEISWKSPRRREWRKGMRLKKKKHADGLLRQQILQGLVFAHPAGGEKDTKDPSGNRKTTVNRNKELKVIKADATTVDPVKIWRQQAAGSQYQQRQRIIEGQRLENEENENKIELKNKQNIKRISTFNLTLVPKHKSFNDEGESMKLHTNSQISTVKEQNSKDLNFPHHYYISASEWESKNKAEVKNANDINDESSDSVEMVTRTSFSISFSEDQNKNVIRRTRIEEEHMPNRNSKDNNTMDNNLATKVAKVENKIEHNTSILEKKIDTDNIHKQNATDSTDAHEIKNEVQQRGNVALDLRKDKAHNEKGVDNKTIKINIKKELGTEKEMKHLPETLISADKLAHLPSNKSNNPKSQNIFGENMK